MQQPNTLEHPPSAILERLAPVVLKVFSSEDFHRVDMRSIAKEAGMSFGTIYRYFGDKESLLFWFIDYWFRDLYPYAIEPLTDASLSFRDALLECLRRHFDFYQRRPNVGRIVFLTVPLDRWMRDPTYQQNDVMKVLLRSFSAAQARGEVRQDITCLAMFDAFGAHFNRAFLMWEYRKRTYSLTDKADELLSILWDGIGTPKLPESKQRRRSTSAVAVRRRK